MNAATEVEDNKNMNHFTIYILQNLGLLTGFGLMLIMAIYGGRQQEKEYSNGKLCDRPVTLEHVFFLAALQLCHKEDTDGVMPRTSERWLTGLNQKGKRNAVVLRDNR
ncbi:hypothetical protein DPMN_117085 [Dreissena polymorpha]|uniref:Uncharacterized protein n=1 Tax=Dreissena polymorpha TaxID=45954 RepID=A0A9D4KQ03_DREPO|nr:hypothetical protein DPMN_117085 [Dreissena polymorpha]